jgi:hypothetical protein
VSGHRDNGSHGGLRRPSHFDLFSIFRRGTERAYGVSPCDTQTTRGGDISAGSNRLVSLLGSGCATSRRSGHLGVLRRGRPQCAECNCLMMLRLMQDVQTLIVYHRNNGPYRACCLNIVGGHSGRTARCPDMSSFCEPSRIGSLVCSRLTRCSKRDIF